MITFRYHVVTLVAVFMAIGLGVLFGATFIDQNIVEGLEAAQVRLGTRNETLRNRITQLEKANESFTEFSKSTREPIVRGQLKDRPVMLLTFDSTPGELVEAVTETLGVAGAPVAGTLQLTDQLSLTDADARQKLASALGSSLGQPDALYALLVSRIIGDLTGANAGSIQKLLDSGLVTGQLNPVLAPAEQVPLPTVVVVLAGQTNKLLTDRVALPLVKSLGDSPVVSAVAEAQTAERLLRPVRDEGVKVVTVDGAETGVGQAALVLGLKAALNGQFGSYGTGDGATTFLPA